MNNFIRPVMARLTLIIFLVSAIGCASETHRKETYRKHPQYESRIAEIKNTGALPADVRVYELSAGGMKELRNDWCETGKANMQHALIKSIQKSSLNLSVLTIDEELKAEIDELQSLYRAVHESIYLHTFEPNNLFPHKKENFVYSLGRIDDVLDKLGVDSLIFVYGSDQISSDARQFWMAASIILLFLGGHTATPSPGFTEVSVAVVDRTGDILWFNLYRSNAFDLRDKNDSLRILSYLISTLPMEK